MRRRHKRFNLPGTLHLVTTVTRVRGLWFVDARVCECILNIFEQYRSRYGVDCIGYVLMPDHLHALLYHENEGQFVSDLMASFKRETSKQIAISSYREKTLWRDHYDDVAIPSSNAMYQSLEYMHSNPVRRGLVENETDYAWSSARFYMELEKANIVTIRRP